MKGKKKLFFLRRFGRRELLENRIFSPAPNCGESRPRMPHTLRTGFNQSLARAQLRPTTRCAVTGNSETKIPNTHNTEKRCVSPAVRADLFYTTKIGFFANSRTLSVGAAAEADGGCHRRTATDLDAILCVVWKRTGEPFAREAVSPQQQQLATVASEPTDV